MRVVAVRSYDCNPQMCCLEKPVKTVCTHACTSAQLDPAARTLCLWPVPSLTRAKPWAETTADESASS